MQDKTVLRDLASRYAEICREPVQRARRNLWKRHNSLKMTRPLIYVRAFAWEEMPQARCLCEDPFFRPYEDFLRYQIFWHSLGDDSIFEPWVTVPAAHQCTGWGVKVERRYSGKPGGSFKVDYPIKQLTDIEKLRVPWHGIAEAQTAANVQRLGDAIGDIITINVDRGPAHRMWQGDISTDLGYLRGIEHFMLDMADNPAWLHRLAKFLADGILKVHDEAEAAGDWGLCAHQNQSMPYAEELPEPAANVNGVKRSRLWGYMAAQEFAGVSPAMHEEFLLRYLGGEAHGVRGALVALGAVLVDRRLRPAPRTRAPLPRPEPGHRRPKVPAVRPDRPLRAVAPREAAARKRVGLAVGAPRRERPG